MRTGLRVVEALGLAAGAREFGVGHCVTGGLLYPGGLQCLAGLVVFAGHGFYYGHVTRKLYSDAEQRPDNCHCTGYCSRRCGLHQGG